MISKSLSTSIRYANLGEVAGPLADFCRAMFPLLVAHADDFGRLPGDSRTIRYLVVPSGNRREKDVGRALGFLDQVGLIRWYEVKSRQFIQINAFDEHQSGLHKRTKSRFPEPPVSEIPGNSGTLPEIPSELNRTEENRTEVQNSGEDAAGLPQPVENSVENYRGRRSRQPAADGNWRASVALAHDVITGAGTTNPDDPDLADLMRQALSQRRIAYDHEPDLPRRALACAMTQRLKTRLSAVGS